LFTSSSFDVGACIGFGVIGWVFKRYDYPVAPGVLGIVLGTEHKQKAQEIS